MSGDSSREDHHLLFELGWNEGDTEISSYGTTIVLRERPYTSNFRGLRTLRISGQDRDDAIRRFLDQDVEVRVITGVFATLNGALPNENTEHFIRVEPVEPLPGEEGDQWIISESGSAVLSFTNAENTNRTFLITRRAARLANMDEFGHRTPPMPSGPGEQ